MFSRINSFRFVAVVVVVFLMLTGLQSSASAAVKRSMSISASPAVGVAGTAVTISGKVTKSPKGTRVLVQRKVGKKWVKVRVTRTVNKAGNYAVKVKRPKQVKTYRYRTFVAKQGNLRAVKSRVIKVAALNQTLVSLSSSTANTTAGTPITLSGTVLPARTGTKVSLQKKVGSRWTTVDITKVTANGTFANDDDVIPTAPTTYRAVVARASRNAPGISNNRFVIAKPVIETSSFLDASRLGAYSTTLRAKFGAGGTWTAQNLPTGLSLNPNTGVISGTPTTVETKQVVIGFTQIGTGLEAAKKTITLVVGDAAKPVITTSTLPTGVVNFGYTTTLKAAGNPVGVWTADNLPAGLSIDGATGIISGTPTTAQTKQVVIGFTQTNTGLSANPQTIGLTVASGSGPVILTDALPPGSVGDPYSFTLTAFGDPEGTWTADGLPAKGLSLNSSTGVISGTPTSAGDINVVVGFTATGNPVPATEKTLTLQIDPGANPVISTSFLPNGTRLSAYNTTLVAAGNPAGTWTAENLPAGLSLNPSTGVISGTPTTVQTNLVVVGFTQTSNGLAATPKELSLQIDQAAPPVISTVALPDGTRLSAYTTTLVATGNPVGTWTASPLPAGLSLNASTGVISGTPTAAGDTSVVVGFTQTSTGVAAEPKTLVLHIDQAAAPVIATTDLPEGMRATPYSTTLMAAGGVAGTWTASPLPAGLSLNSSTGVISGTPTTVGSTSVVIGFTQTSTGLPALGKTLELTINQVEPVITNAARLPDGTPLLSYSVQLAVSPSLVGTWERISGSTPPGISVKSNGRVSGTGSLPGNFTFTVRFTETGTGVTATKTFFLKVA